MITEINTSEYEHIETMTLNGIEFSSTYNHNYFYNKHNGELILVESDDDQTCNYYRIRKVGRDFFSHYIGFSEDQYGFGIFDDNYKGYPYRNNNIVELDDTF